MDWQEEYKRKLASAEEAVKVVKSGDRVHVAWQRSPQLLMKALFARRDELENVQIRGISNDFDPGWYQPGWEDTFPLVVEVFQTDLERSLMDAKRCDFMPHGYDNQLRVEERPDERKELDVLMVVVSPPDRNGFCSFGYTLWIKKLLAQKAKKVIAEVDGNYPRTYGDNFIHVSEIDSFTENTLPRWWGNADIERYLAIMVEDKERREKLRQAISWIAPARRGRVIPRLLRTKTELLDKDKLPSNFLNPGPTEVQKRILETMATLINDGDTFQVGSGFVASNFCDFLHNKVDLGAHSEVGGNGLGRLVRAGVVTGKYKTLHTGKVVLAAHPRADAEDLDHMDNNPIFELYSSPYVVNIKTIAAHNNMVSCNSAISVDLTGQINSETTSDARLRGGPGGQPAFHMGAVLSKGGRAITAFPSTALNGTVSRIVPQLEEGAVVTVPRNFADYIVTEYGVARLMGKTVRERAEELIRVAHPDFRAELRKAAKKLFYP